MLLTIAALVLIVVPVEEESPPPLTTTTSTAITKITNPTTTTSTITTTTTTIVLPFLPLPPAELETGPPPTDAALACMWIDGLDRDKHLTDFIVGFCFDVAEAFTDIIDVALPDRLDPDRVPADFEEYRLDVLHGLYTMGAESKGSLIANAENWGCPRNERLRPPDFLNFECVYYGGRVPTGPLSHMSHTLPGRSLRQLGYLIDPYNIYEAALLTAGLIYEVGGNGWYHYWHVHWGLNSFITPYGIIGVYFCPSDPYWDLVRGGKQACPYD